MEDGIHINIPFLIKMVFGMELITIIKDKKPLINPDNMKKVILIEKKKLECHGMI
jgi:hypothetical protein